MVLLIEGAQHCMKPRTAVSNGKDIFETTAFNSSPAWILGTIKQFYRIQLHATSSWLSWSINCCFEKALCGSVILFVILAPVYSRSIMKHSGDVRLGCFSGILITIMRFAYKWIFSGNKTLNSSNTIVFCHMWWVHFYNLEKLISVFCYQFLNVFWATFQAYF